MKFPQSILSRVGLSVLACAGLLASPTLAQQGEGESPYLQIYDALFEHSWDEGDGLFFEEAVYEAGQHYGTTNHGEAFGVRLVEFENLDIHDPEFLQTLDSVSYRNALAMENMYMVSGTIWSSSAEIKFVGSIAERRDATGMTFELKPSVYYSTVESLYSTTPANASNLPGCQEKTFIVYVYGPGDDPGVCFDCWIEYMNAVDQARSDYESAMVTATLNFNNAAAAFEQGVIDAVAAGQAGLRNCIRYLGLSGFASICMDMVMTNFNNTIANLLNDLATAQAAWDTAMNDAKSAYQTAMGEAGAALIECLEDCDASPPVIIGFYSITYGCGTVTITYHTI